MDLKGLKNTFSSITEGAALKTPLEKDEQVILKTPAARFVKTGNTLGGTMHITNKRVIYEAGGINLTSQQRDLIDIMPINEITGFSIADNVGLVNLIAIPGINKDKAVKIQTVNTANVYNVGGKSKEIIELLKNICPKAVELEKQGYIDNLKGNMLGHKVSNSSNDHQGVNSTSNDGNICISCGASNAEGVKFCGECGTKLAMDCPKCGSSISKGQKFCNVCGTSLIPKCPQCGVETIEGVKFCNECGAKI